jgi:hypothetical protein
MKSIISSILAAIAVIALFLACGEADTAFNQILWSGSWMLVCFISGKASTKFIDDIDKE